jgi:hypothetical protein
VPLSLPLSQLQQQPPTGNTIPAAAAAAASASTSSTAAATAATAAAISQDILNSSGTAGSGCSIATHLIEVPADSTSLLPGAVSLLDYGDTIIVRVNVPSLSSAHSGNATTTTSTSTAAKEVISEEKEQKLREKEKLQTLAAAEELFSYAQRIARERYPVSTVYFLQRPGTPQDRLLYCRLNPSHMDSRDTLVRSVSQCMALSLSSSAGARGSISISASASASASANAGAAPVSITGTGTTASAANATAAASTVDVLQRYAPITDQLHFGKYLSLAAPTQAAQLLELSILAPAYPGSTSTSTSTSTDTSTTGGIPMFPSPSSASNGKPNFNGTGADYYSSSRLQPQVFPTSQRGYIAAAASMEDREALSSSSRGIDGSNGAEV